MSLNRRSAIEFLPSPRSSGDRAHASGAWCAGSNPAGGTLTLMPKHRWDDIKAFAEATARMTAATIRTLSRGDVRGEAEGKDILDYRNGRGATAIAAFSTRARVGGAGRLADQSAQSRQARTRPTGDYRQLRRCAEARAHRAVEGQFRCRPHVAAGEPAGPVKGGRQEIPHATPATTFPLAWPCSR